MGEKSVQGIACRGDSLTAGGRQYLHYCFCRREVGAMMRDAAIKTQDMLALENMGLDALITIV